MIISDLCYLETASEAASIAGGSCSNKKEEKKNNKDNYNKYFKKTTTQVAVANTGVAVIAKGKNEIYINNEKTGDIAIKQSA